MTNKPLGFSWDLPDDMDDVVNAAQRIIDGVVIDIDQLDPSTGNFPVDDELIENMNYYEAMARYYAEHGGKK